MAPRPGDQPTSGRSAGRIRATAAVYIILGVVQRSLALILLPLVTRVLTPAEYGLVSLATTTVTVVGFVVASSAEPPLFRALVIGEMPFALTARRYLLWYLPVVTLLLGGAIVLISGTTVTALTWALELASAGPLAALSIYALPLCRAQDKLRLFILLSLSWVILLAATKIVFLAWLLPGPVGWAASDLLAAIVGWFLSVLSLRTTGKVFGKVRMPWKEFASTCAPLIPQRMALWGLTVGSRPVLGPFVTSEQLGLFALAANLASVALVLLTEANRAMHLEYAREKIPAPTSITRSVAQTQVLAAILLPAVLSAGIAIAGPLVITSAFVASAALAAPLLVGQVLYGLHVIPMNYIMMTAGRFRWSSLAPAAGAIATVSMVALGGAVGSVSIAAVGSAAGSLILLVAAWWTVRLEGLDLRWRALVPRPLPLGLSIVALFTGLASLMTYPTTLSLALGAGSMTLVLLAGLLIVVLSNTRAHLPEHR